jgi:hypothetical protein
VLGGVAVVAGSWVLARVVVAVALVVAAQTLDHVAPGRAAPLDSGLLAWDGEYYRDIAAGGYGATSADGLRFFPLLPLAARVLAVLLGGSEGVALVVVANLAALAAAWVIYALVLHEGCGEAAARRSVWLVALFPSAFVLAWAYAESLLLLTSAACFLFLRRARWAPAALVGFLAGLCRPLGALLALPAAVEAWRDRSAADARARAASALAVVAPPLGSLTFFAWSSVAGYGFWAPIREQQELRGDAVDPITRVVRGVGDLGGDSGRTDVLVALALVVLVVLCARLLPASYWVFSVAVLAVSLGASSLNSLERYSLNAFPLVVALAVAARHALAERVLLVTFSAGLAALTALAWLGPFVP